MCTKFGVRQLVIWLLLLLGMVALTFLTMRQVMTDPWLQLDDFVEYWSAGRLNMTGGNPYDPQQMETLQAQTGRTYAIPVMMWNPPWMLALVMPFGAVSYVIGRVAWLFVNFVLVFVCVELLWRMYDGASRYRWIGWLVGLGFMPVLQALKTGQSGTLLLIGIVGFLYFVEQRKDFWAGALLMLATYKPHILYLVFIVLLFWSWKYRRWGALLGLAAALAASTVIVWLANPAFLQQYLYAVDNFPPTDWATPTIGGALRLFFGTQHFWMQFVGPAIGMLWLALYWKRHATSWDWVANAPLLVLVSMVTSAYGWTSDQSVALVAIIAVFAVYANHRWMVCVKVCVGLFVLLNLILALTPGNQIYRWWVGPTQLLWYMLAHHCARSVSAAVQGE